MLADPTFVDLRDRLLTTPDSAGMLRMRDLVRELALHTQLSDDEFMRKLCSGGLLAAPLSGRKIAISGSAHEHYKTDAKQQPILGIGDAVAEGMLIFGGEVVVNSFTASMNHARLAHLQNYGKRCVYVQADMSTDDGARKFVLDSFEALEGLDVLVLNAGTYSQPEFGKMAMADFQHIFSLNLQGPLFAMQESINLVEREGIKSARIIVTSSINAQLSETHHLLYDASKAALERAIKSLALDLAKRNSGIRVNAVAPGLLYTPLTHEALTAEAEVQEHAEAAVPLGIGRAEDIIMPYVSLAMASNNYITATVVDASGGLRETQGTERYTRIHLEQ